ncbi:hypothetical protein [Brevundimonas sp.]|nr:hypothetical protein [Brevundimonas sp.]
MTTSSNAKASTSKAVIDRTSDGVRRKSLKRDKLKLGLVVIGEALALLR